MTRRAIAVAVAAGLGWPAGGPPVPAVGPGATPLRHRLRSSRPRRRGPRQAGPDGSQPARRRAGGLRGRRPPADPVVPASCSGRAPSGRGPAARAGAGFRGARASAGLPARTRTRGTSTWSPWSSTSSVSTAGRSRARRAWRLAGLTDRSDLLVSVFTIRQKLGLVQQFTDERSLVEAAVREATGSLDTRYVNATEMLDEAVAREAVARRQLEAAMGAATWPRASRPAWPAWAARSTWPAWRSTPCA